MNNNKIIDVCKAYSSKIVTLGPDLQTEHIWWMLNQIPLFLEEGRKEKANRWLGFIQGFLWERGIYTIAEMKEHNKPSL